MREGDLTEQIIGGAIEVHRHWGPGLYEEICERSLCHELRLRKVAFESQVKLPLLYKGERVGDDLRLDLIVEGKVVVANLAFARTSPPCLCVSVVSLLAERIGVECWSGARCQ
jgi:GxxExxY protein